MQVVIQAAVAAAAHFMMQVKMRLCFLRVPPHLKKLAVDEPKQVNKEVLGLSRCSEVLKHACSAGEDGTLTGVGQQQLRVHLVRLPRAGQRAHCKCRELPQKTRPRQSRRLELELVDELYRNLRRIRNDRLPSHPA